MKRILFIIVLISVSVLAFSQRENVLPRKSTSAATDTIRVVKDNQSALMLRSVLQGAIYDSLATHTDTLQALRADIDAGGSVDVMDSIAVHRTELNNLHDSITDHRTDIDANLDSIAIHRTELNNAVDSIADHRTEINANTSTGSMNASNISANSVFISVNTADIGSLEDSISKHTDTLQVHQDQISELQDATSQVDSSGVSINTNGISEYTADEGVTIDGVQLKDNNIQLETVTGQLQFGGTANYINGSSAGNVINFYTNSTQKLLIGPLSISSTVTLNPVGSVTLGQVGAYWNAVYANRYYIDNTSSFMDVSGSDMTFTDATAGTKTLTELAASGGIADSSWVSIRTDTIRPYSVSNDTLSIYIGDSEGTGYMRFESEDNGYKGRIHASGGTISMSTTNDASTLSSTISTLTGGSILMTSNNSTGLFSVSLGDEGLKYGADYSAYYTGLSLVTKGDVDTAINLQYSGALTDGAPTDAEIDSVTGTTPAAVGAGWKCTILDTTGSGLIYIIISDGTNWQYTTMTIAL